MDVAAVRHLEEIGFESWPALETERVDEWVLRASAGTTRRSNSVTPLGPGRRRLDEMIELSERWLIDRGQIPVFRLVEPLQPAQLDATLGEAGYQMSDPTDTLVLDGVHGRHHPEVQIGTALTGTWLRALGRLVGLPAEPVPATRRLLQAAPSPTGFASVVSGGVVVGVGMCTVVDAHAGIFNMNTAQANRRTGVAGAILDELLHFAGDVGATTAWLQATCANTAAQAFYRSRGFTDAYRYWYRMTSET